MPVLSDFRTVFGSGPATPAAYSGNFLAGLAYKCLGPKIQWLQGYDIWVCASGQTALGPSYKFATWVEISSSAAQLVPGSTVTASGALTPGAWNRVLLATPIPLAIGTPFIAAAGWTTTDGGGTGFPFLASQFNSGAPFASGVTATNLFAYSDGTAGGTAGTQNPTVGGQQGLFGTASSDPGANCPTQGSSSANFWVAPVVSDTAPAGYTGNYSLWPANAIGNLAVGVDLNVQYNVGTEIAISAPVLLNAIRYLSPSGAANLATRAAVWSVTAGGLGGAEVTAIASPSWSGAAGSGWVQANFASPPLLAAGKYRVAVFNANGTVAPGWNAFDATTNYWGTGDGSGGIQNGPLSAPGLAAASLAYTYNGSNPGGTPPYSTGGTEKGQGTFGQLPGGLDGIPYLYVDAQAQVYFVDAVVSAAPAADMGGDDPPWHLRRRR